MTLPIGAVAALFNTRRCLYWLWLGAYMVGDMRPHTELYWPVREESHKGLCRSEPGHVPRVIVSEFFAVSNSE